MTLGISGPFSGKSKAYGELILLSTEKIRREFDLDISFNFKDDQADLRKAKEVANLFIKENVSAVIGHFNSACAKVVAEIYHEHQKVFIAPASTAVYIPNENEGYVFRTCPDNFSQVLLLIDFCKSNKISSVGIIADDTLYANELSLLSEIELTKSRIRVKYIKSLDVISKVELVWFLGKHHSCLENYNSILKASLPLHIPLMFCDDCFIDEFITHVKDTYSNILVFGLSKDGYINIFEDSLRILINHLAYKTELAFKIPSWQIYKITELNV